MKTLLIAATLVAAMAAPAMARDHDGGRPGYSQNGNGDRGYENREHGDRDGYRGGDRDGGHGDRNQGYRGGYGGANYGGNGYGGGYNRGPQQAYYAPRGYGYNAPVAYRGGYYRPVYNPRPVIYVPPRYYGRTVVYTNGYNNGYYQQPVVAQVGYGGGYNNGYYNNGCRSTGTGAVIGAIAGGLIGNGVAGYRDRGLGTVIGAGLGAVTGTAIERNGRCGY
jgi:hypothetical protein